MSGENPKTILLMDDEAIPAANGPGGSALPWFKRTAALGSAGVAIVAILSLLGHLPGLRVLARIRPDYVPMAITTAVCFLFLAAALFLQARKPRQGPGLLAMEAPAILVILFSLLNVAGSLAGMDLNFEDRLIPEMGRLGKFSVGHMSPIAGAVFIMAGLGTFLLLLRSRSSRHARRLGHGSAGLGVLTMLAGATVLLSYLYGAPLLYGGTTVPMAATTAIGFLLLGATLAAAVGPESFPMSLVTGDSTSARLSRVFLPLTVTVVLLQGILSRIVSVKPVIHHALFLAALVIAVGTITAFVIVRVAHSIGSSLDEVNRKLRQSEERYRSILNASPDSIAITDMEGRIIMVSPAILTMLGCQREEEVLGRLFTEFVDPDDCARASSNVALMSQGTMTGLGEYHGLRADGSTLDLEVNGGFVRGADGRPTQMVFVIRDISERKRAEKLTETLYKISQAVYSTENLNELFKHVHLALANIIPTDNLYIALLSDDGKTMNFPYFIDEKNPSDTSSIAADNMQSLTVDVLSTKRSLLLDETELLDRYASGRNKVWGTAPKCWLGVPLMIRETIIGVMAVQDYHKAGAYGRKDVALLESAAGQIAVAIDIKRTEKALRESEEKYRTLVEKANEAIIIAQDGTFVFANRRMSELLGVPTGDLQGKPFIDFVWPEDRELVNANYRKRIAGEPVCDAYDFRFIGAGGRLIWVFLSATAILWKGKPATLNLLTDITGRKQAEEEVNRQLAEKVILLKEVHHRIKNNIASIGGLLSLHLQSVTNLEAIAVLKDTIGRVNSMRLLYDKLLLSEDYKDISVKNYLGDLIDTIISIFPNAKKITLDKRIADFHLDAKQLFPLGSIINELLTNIMKYAFINRDDGLIKISLANADKHVTLIIQDDGVGLPAGFDVDKSKGFGLMLVKMLSQQLAGSFSIESQAGTRSKIEFNI